MSRDKWPIRTFRSLDPEVPGGFPPVAIRGQGPAPSFRPTEQAAWCAKPNSALLTSAWETCLQPWIDLYLDIRTRGEVAMVTAGAKLEPPKKNGRTKFTQETKAIISVGIGIAALIVASLVLLQMLHSAIQLRITDANERIASLRNLIGDEINGKIGNIEREIDEISDGLLELKADLKSSTKDLQRHDEDISRRLETTVHELRQRDGRGSDP